MQIELGSRVVASDGAPVGKVDRLVIDPETRILVELIVHQGRFVTHDRIVARTLIDDIGADGVVRLTIGGGEIDRLPQFVQVDYVTPHAGWDSVLYPRGGSNMLAEGSYAGIGGGGAFSATNPVVGAPDSFLGTSQYGDVNLEVRSNLPLNALVVDRGTDVVDVAGKKVGELDDLIYDDAGAITGLRVRHGLLGRQHDYVPLGAVAGASPRRIRLAIAADEIAAEEPAKTPAPE